MIKTQAVEFHTEMIDTPGEFILHRQYYNALNVTAAEADVIGFLKVQKHNKFFTRIW